MIVQEADIGIALALGGSTYFSYMPHVAGGLLLGGPFNSDVDRISEDGYISGQPRKEPDMTRTPVFVAVTVLVACFAMALNAQEPPKPPTDPLAELRPPKEAPVAKPAPKEDLRVRMLYDLDLATPYITSYSTSTGGLATMQLSLVSKNGGAAIAPNGLYAICWVCGNKSGAMLIDPVSGSVTTVTPLEGKFTLILQRAQRVAPKKMPVELPPVPPPPDFSPPKKTEPNPPAPTKPY